MAATRLRSPRSSTWTLHILTLAPEQIFKGLKSGDKARVIFDVPDLQVKFGPDGGAKPVRQRSNGRNAGLVSILVLVVILGSFSVRAVGLHRPRWWRCLRSHNLSRRRLVHESAGPETHSFAATTKARFDTRSGARRQPEQPCCCFTRNIKQHSSRRSEHQRSCNRRRLGSVPRHRAESSATSRHLQEAAHQ